MNWLRKQPDPARNSVAPGDYNLGSLESRAAARVLAGKKAETDGVRISLVLVGQNRPDKKPQPVRRWAKGGLMEVEEFYADDTDYPEARPPSGGEQPQ